MSQIQLPARAEAIEQRLRNLASGSRFGAVCYAFEELPSTMDLADRLAEDGAPEGACVWAERQTEGRGRAGRQWTSPPGGVYCSLIVRPRRSVHELPQLALVAGLATAQAVHEAAGLSASIRWPNDVLVQGRKLAGILVEAASHADTHHAVVGIGINVTTPVSELPEGSTALQEWIAPAPDRYRFAATLWRALERCYDDWNRDGFAAIRPQLIPWIGLFGQLVHITTERERFEGQALDLDERGRLVMRLDSGMLRAFEVGEVALLR